MVVTDYVTLSLNKRSAYRYLDPEGNEKILIDHNQVILPDQCTIDSKDCIVDDGATYIWTPPSEQDKCGLYNLRTTMGVDVTSEVTAEEGDVTTFIATDDTMVRLEKKYPPKVMCGSVVYATNYDQLFLTNDMENEEFGRPLPPSEGSPYLYANTKVHFAYESLKEGLEETVLQLRADICRKDETNRLREYAGQAAAQRSLTDGDTVRVQDNQFGTASGEVWWIYACRPIIVQARATPGVCFNALPVDLSDQDMQR